MTKALRVTHRKGDACPEDMFVVVPPEALIKAVFQRDVEVIGERSPYHVKYDGGTDQEGAPIFLDIVRDPPCTIDGGGLRVEDISQAHRWSGIQLGVTPPHPINNLRFTV
jgi:hypothetical protein